MKITIIGHGNVGSALADRWAAKGHEIVIGARNPQDSKLEPLLAAGKVRAPTVDGPVMLTIKPGTSGGTTMRLTGKGFSRKGGGRGDQLVTIQIVLPQDIAPLKDALGSWTDTSDPRADLGA